MKFAVQMYSLREQCKSPEALLKTLEAVREIGYEGVEFAGYQGLPAKALKEKCGALGLTVVGTHNNPVELFETLDQTIAFDRALGCENIVLAWAPTETAEEVAELVERLAAAAAQAAQAGLRVLYHNHSHEFKLIDGVYPLDRIKTACLLELDTYWSFHAGIDTPRYLRENRGRIGLIHLKDGKGGTPCALGEGENNIPAILRAAREIGAQWAVVENDAPVPDGLSDVARSLEYLKNNEMIKEALA